MSHDKISAEGYALKMSGEIHDWLADLRGSNPRAAMRVTRALAALLEEGPDLGDPLVVSTTGSWPWALAEGLDRSYQESLERLTALRRGAADAVALVEDIQDQVAELQVAQAKLEDLNRKASNEGRPQEAAQAASDLAAVRRQAAEMRHLLPTVIEARDRLGEAARRLRARTDAFRSRKEVLKASYVAAESRLKVHETIAAMFLTGDDRDQREEDAREAISAAEALANATAQMERELGQESWPEGLMELRPGAPVRSDIRILFAVEPPRTVLAIAVLEEADQFSEALLASADMLRRIRAGQAPEATAHAYDNTRSFLTEFYPAGV
jgi:phage shock protein A